MRFTGPFLLLSALLLASSSAFGQASAYGTVSLTDYGYEFNGTGIVFSDHPGFGFGALYEVPTSSRAVFGVDARGSFSPGATGGAKAFVSGRVAFHPRSNSLRPYFQIGLGEIHARVPRLSFAIDPQTVNRFGLDLAVGLDVRLNPSFDYRVVELESGAGFSSAIKEDGSASLSTGLVYHFPPGKRTNP